MDMLSRNQRGTSQRPSAAAPIKLVAIDLDGTLLNTHKKVSEQTVSALRSLPADLRVVIASARPPRSVRHIYESLGLRTWQINYNGAMIWDEPAKQVVFHRPMQGRLVHQIVTSARKMCEQVLVSCEIQDRWLTDRADNSFTTETGRMFKPDSVCPVDEICTQDVTKLMLLGETEMLAELEAPLRQQFGEHVTILQTDRDLIQIMNKRAGKSSALKRVAQHYEVPLKQVMAIGDAPNDVGMLQLAGVAVAMDNAHARVKQVAHWVAPSNDDHGVHAALVKYGLCQ
jgi:Cof subfamily protein (haloacid dehalogenase superfamily)